MLAFSCCLFNWFAEKMAAQEVSDGITNVETTARSFDMKACLSFRVVCLVVLPKRMSARICGAIGANVATQGVSEDTKNIEATAWSSDMRACLLFNVCCLVVLPKEDVCTNLWCDCFACGYAGRFRRHYSFGSNS